MWRSVLLGVVLAGVLAGCSLDAQGGPASGTNGRLGALYEPNASSLRLLRGDKSPVTIRTLRGGRRVRIVRTQSLGCSPPVGSVPDPVAACRALRDFLANYRPPAGRRRCFAGSHPRPGFVVEVYGRAAGKLVGAAVLTTGRCRFGERWIRDLKTVTGLAGT